MRIGMASCSSCQWLSGTVAMTTETFTSQSMTRSGDFTTRETIIGRGANLDMELPSPIVVHSQPMVYFQVKEEKVKVRRRMSKRNDFRKRKSRITTQLSPRLPNLPLQQGKIDINSS